MIGQLRFNENGRWEIVNADENRSVELTSGDCVKIMINHIWIATRIESGWNDMLKKAVYYSTVPGTTLYEGQAAEIEGY